MTVLSTPAFTTIALLQDSVDVVVSVIVLGVTMP